MMGPVIALSDARTAVRQASLSRPGGFVWWYVDLFDERGNGLVLIWSWGLPFLPGVVSAAREGTGAAPHTRPSINLAIYRDGREDFYLLQESQQASWDGDDRWTFDRTVITRRQVAGRVELQVDLDLDVPGCEALRGRISIEGPACTGLAGGDGPHLWTPLSVGARGTTDLRCGDVAWKLEGEAYHDRNQSLESFHDLGIEQWLWGRARVGDDDVIFYSVDGRQGEGVHCILRLRDGVVIEQRAVAPVVRERRRTGWGLFIPREVALPLADGDVVLRTRHVLDKSPFYARGTMTTSCGHGSFEVLKAPALDSAWFRPLVRMRVHLAGRANSMWLPLFCGPAEGRLARLLSRAKPAARLEARR